MGRAHTTPDRIEQVQIHLITVGIQQIRQDPNDEQLNELALELQAHGLMQPIGVAQTGPREYQLLWGSRRLAAAKRIGWTSIEAKIKELNGQTVRSIAARENIHRRDLTINEEVDLVKVMHDDERMSPSEIGVLLGKSRNWVNARLMIPNLPQDVRDALLEERISTGQAELLGNVADEGTRMQLIQHIVNERWTLAMLRGAIQSITGNPDNTAAIAAGVAAAAPPPGRAAMHCTCAACGQSSPITELRWIQVHVRDCTAVG